MLPSKRKSVSSVPLYGSELSPSKLSGDTVLIFCQPMQLRTEFDILTLREKWNNWEANSLMWHGPCCYRVQFSFSIYNGSSISALERFSVNSTATYCVQGMEIFRQNHYSSFFPSHCLCKQNQLRTKVFASRQHVFSGKILLNIFVFLP